MWLPSGVIAILGVVGVMVFNLTGHSSWSLWVILGAVVLGALVYRR